MYEILNKRYLKENIILLEIKAPLVAINAKPGQFVILRVDENGERIPLTIFDKTEESISVIYQVVGATTKKLSTLNVGDCLCDFVGPLGKATNTKDIKNAIVIGGGIGCAIAYPIAKKLIKEGAKVTNIIGFRNKDFVILENEFKALNASLYITTDDGSYGEKGVVTNPLRKLLERNTYDCVYAIGPLPMMKYVALTTKKFNVKTLVSMNSIMIDGTGMCGGCRIKVGSDLKFACVDGPEFDGHLVDFDEAIIRNGFYNNVEKDKHEDVCRLLGDINE
ncbi:MAG TPA: sulfide/dihydroorotate dehydrogenase-like FAD/NAD-binding protein [Acholeplasmataceae bacterium]|jgi:ferredoxin--NADP+ reductase|nr:sulfide/dihydroorotate dehydrogenase-like FAD/NAD-binding protein [Acholeplasmataceae bacterium]